MRWRVRIQARAFGDCRESDVGKRVLVTGGSGFIGQHLIRRLVQERNEVWGLVRSSTAGDTLEALGARGVYIGDLQDASSLVPAVREAETVFHLGALVDHGGPSLWDRLYEVNVLGTQRLLTAAAQAGVPRFINVSCAVVTGPTGLAPGDENARLRPQTHLAKSKADAERIVGYFADHAEEMQVATLRPSFVIGPGDLDSVTHLLFSMVHRRQFAFIGSGGNPIDLVHVDDVVSGVLLAAEQPQVAGRTYILASPRPYTLREVVRTIAEAVNAPTPRRRTWGLVAAARANVNEALSLLGARRAFRRSWVDYLSHNYVYSSALASRELGYAPKVDLREAIPEAAKWYLDRGYL